MFKHKVLNKYISPDFDPAKIPRLRLGKNRQIKVRLVAPLSMQCKAWGQWIGKGTKFNARKEAVEGEKFHGMQTWRNITYKTDYENLNYEVEKGAQRNFEPRREEKAINEELQREREIKQAAHSSAESKASVGGGGGLTALSYALQGIKSVKPKEKSNDQSVKIEDPTPPTTLAGMLGAYGSDDAGDVCALKIAQEIVSTDLSAQLRDDLVIADRRCLHDDRLSIAPLADIHVSIAKDS
ncbi:hypothetical protein EV175_001741 [Coemansia sp. RSA 1933]|nr:hypothetical protein EV175_001741 [Coemansia sp. RSA 1933]